MRSLLEPLRTLLILGRVSNLPTVWSNLFAGWVIADGPRVDIVAPVGYRGPDATPWPMLFVLLGGSLLYVGGMYLNDYCDVAFDTRYGPERPIPAGKISRRTVGFLAALWFTAGFGCFARFGPTTVGIALLLITAIVVYDFHHKNVAWAPLLMAACRCLLYLLAASSLADSDYYSTFDGAWWNDALDYVHDGWWSSARQLIWFLPATLPIGLYVAGISYLARGESRPDKPKRWPLLLLLLAPIPLAGIYGILIRSLSWELVPSPHDDPLQLIGRLVPWLFLPAWMAWLLVPFWRKTKPSIGRVVSGLLAGIVLLDILVIALRVGPYAIVLLPLFLLALLLQRVIPAT